MIWCVEDDAAIRDIELYALGSTGFEAKGFEDGAVFWEALQSEKPDLVVLDVMLPGLDGVELLRKIRSDSRFADLLICPLSWLRQRVQNMIRFRVSTLARMTMW